MRKSSFFYLGCLLLVTILVPFDSIADTHIRVGVYENRPLFFTDADRKVKGIFADILNYVAKKEGWTIEYVNKSWIECYEDLRSGKLADAVPVPVGHGAQPGSPAAPHS